MRKKKQKVDENQLRLVYPNIGDGGEVDYAYGIDPRVNDLVDEWVGLKDGYAQKYSQTVKHWVNPPIQYYSYPTVQPSPAHKPSLFVVVDIDGVVLDMEHRLRYITGDNKDYDTFYSDGALLGDEPIESGIGLIDGLLSGGRYFQKTLIFLTGRPERTRSTTTKILDAIGEWVDYQIYMREEGDYRKSSVVKKEMWEQKIAHQIKNGDVVWFIDDDPLNCVSIASLSPQIQTITFGVKRI